MKRRTTIVAAATALIVLLGVLAFRGLDLDGWNIHLPQIEGATAKNEKRAAAVKPDTSAITTGLTENKRPENRALPAFGNGTPTVTVFPKPELKDAKDPEAAPPYWCFRTYSPGLPWMMNSDERNPGNAARSELENVWNGVRSLRMESAAVGETRQEQLSMFSAQRNVLWQAIQAAPFRGKRVVFRPYLRVTPGGNLTAFLRSWDGLNGAPGLSLDTNAPTKTPFTIWRGAWGNPRLVLDVPMDAKIIYYGIVHSGAVPVWIDHVEFNVDPAAPILDISSNFSRYISMGQYLEKLPSLPIDANWVWNEPKNLDFEIVHPEKNEVVETTPPPPC